MRAPWSTSAVVFALLILAGAGRADSADPAGEPYLGGAGGLYLLAEPGELTVDITKRDLNRRGSKAVLRAILVGPDRRVIQEVVIPDDGQSRGSGRGPLQQVRLTTHVPRPGVYAVNITVAQDRYGEEAVWGFATNCPRYVIETSRGHRDERHQEPIVLSGPATPADICFLPPPRRFAIEITGLPPAVGEVAVYDGQDRRVQTLPVDRQGRAAGSFASERMAAESPWRLHVPARQATIHIDGVTRWDNGDPYPDLSYWTNQRSAWFALPEYRWLITPYSRLIYAPAGASGEVAFRVHNNSDQPRTIRLDLEFPESAWPLELDRKRVSLAGKASVEVKARYAAAADGQPRTAHLRATPEQDPDFTTYATLEVRGGEAPATQPLSMPLVLKPYQHENEQFGYLPDYPLDNQPYFDLQNQPLISTGDGIATWRDGRWMETKLRSAIQAGAAGSDRSDQSDRGSPAAGQSASWRLASTKLAFDGQNRLYAVARSDRQTAILVSNNQGRTFSVCTLPGGSRAASFDLGEFTGHNSSDEPPPLVRYTRTASDPKLFWRRLHDLELFVPAVRNGRLEAGEPILISQKCIGLASHSGIPSTVAAGNGRVHVVWAEATEPEEKVPGVPTYVVTYDRQSRQLSEPALIGYGAPPNDIHNTPSITLDSRGHLHVLAGTHGRPFQYARSLQPNTAASGWTEAVPAGTNLPQTYIGMVCGPDDTLHLTYRLWRSGEEPHSASQYAALAYQQKKADEPWSPPQILVVPPFSEYSVYYHRLTIDRRGSLFLSCDSWSTFWFYRTDHPGSRRSLLTSPDGGQSWQLAETADLIAPQ